MILVSSVESRYYCELGGGETARVFPPVIIAATDGGRQLAITVPTSSLAGALAEISSIDSLDRMSVSCAYILCIIMLLAQMVRSVRGSHGLSHPILSLLRTSSTSSSADDEVEIISSKTVYSSKFRQIVQKKIKFVKRDKTFDFDITSNCGTRAVAVFAFDRKRMSLCMISEYHPGPEKWMFGLPAGCIESDKHSSVQMAAEMELEEEAQLRAGNGNYYVSLMEDSESQFLPMDKYTDNGIHPFLVLDSQLVDDPRAPDEEESITVHRDMSYDQVMDLIRTGRVNTVSAASIFLGYQKLDELNIEYK